MDFQKIMATRIGVPLLSFHFRPHQILLTLTTVLCIIFIWTLASRAVIVYEDFIIAQKYTSAVCTAYDVRTIGWQDCTYCSKASILDNARQHPWTRCYPSRMLCVHVKVNYIVLWDEVANEVGNILLHPTHEHLDSYDRCSYDVCYRNETENAKEAQSYADHWIVQIALERQRFDCYFHKQKRRHAIEQVPFSGIHAVKKTAWPFIGVMTCLGLIYYLQRKYKWIRQEYISEKQIILSR